MLAEFVQQEKSREYILGFPVGLDQETSEILTTDPHDLLVELFKNSPDKIFLLSKTGFSMHTQIQTWTNLYNQALSNQITFTDVQKHITSKTIEDVIGFYFEYLSKQDVFPIRVEFKETHEGKTVWASKYNQTLESLALPNEREGALAEGVKKAVEILVNSDPGTVVFVNSPPKWSGLGHDHPDTQTYVYWIREDGNLDALTIRTNLGVAEGEKLTNVDMSPNDDLKERIKRIVRSPVTITSASIDSVLDLIEEVSGSSFAKQRYEIANRDKLFTLNETAMSIINKLQEGLSNCTDFLSYENIKTFTIEVGRAVLELAKQTLPQKSSYTAGWNYQPNYSLQYSSNYAEYYAIYEEVQAIPGCNGGGNKNRFTLNSLAAGIFGTNQITVTDGRCQKCGTTENVACGWCKPCWKRYGTG